MAETCPKCGKEVQWIGNLGSHFAVKHPRQFLDFMESIESRKSPPPVVAEEPPVEEDPWDKPMEWD